MTGGRRRLSLGVLAAVVLIAGACGSGSEEPEAAQPTPTVEQQRTAEPSQPTAEPSQPTAVELAPPETGSSLVQRSLAFLDHLEAGDYEQMVALMTPAYRDVSFGTTTAAQFWTFSSRFDWVPDVAPECAAVGTQVECTWLGTDAVSRELGYRKRGELLFSYEEGAIKDIIYFANDSEVVVAVIGWVDANYPGEPACAATAQEFDDYYGGPGVLAAADGEVFGEACAERMIEHAAEYRDSGLYLPPLD